MPVIYVHGVNVRLNEYEKNVPNVRRKLAEFGPKQHFDSYFWGGHTVPLHWGGASIPGVVETGNDLEPQVVGTEVDLPALQDLLLLNPWAELQSLQPEVPPKSTDRGYTNWQNRNDFFADGKEDLKEALRENLAGIDGLAPDKFVDHAVETAIKLVQAMGLRVDQTAALPPLRRALTATIFRRLPISPPGEPIVSWEAILEQVELATNRAYGGTQGAGKYLVPPILSLATWVLRRGQRQTAMPGLIRFMGDIFVYLQNRQPYLDGLEAVVVRAIETEKKEMGRATPLRIVAHSLGGIISYDYCCWKKEREIERLATVGSQVGLFAEGDLLWEKYIPKATGDQRPAPMNIRSWINLYDLNDMLSFRVAPIFRGVTLEDAYESGKPFPDAHSAYWDAEEVYRKICL